MIKPIETIYKGYRFRSRLEARWAVFFDALEFDWEYEKEGFDIDGEWYLPDFWIVELGVWIEIKGSADCNERLLEKFGISNSYGPLLIYKNESQLSDIPQLYIKCLDTCDSGGGIFNNFDDPVYLAYCIECNKTVIDFNGLRNDRNIHYGEDWKIYDACRHDVPDYSYYYVMKAWQKAKQARFEHGECG